MSREQITEIRAAVDDVMAFIESNPLNALPDSAIAKIDRICRHAGLEGDDKTVAEKIIWLRRHIDTLTMILYGSSDNQAPTGAQYTAPVPLTTRTT